MTQHILQLEETSSNEQSASQDFRLVGFLCGFCWWWRGRGWPEKFSEKLAPEKSQRQGPNRLEPPFEKLPPIHQVSCQFWRAKCLNERNNYYLKSTAICCLLSNAKKACYPNFGEIVYFLLSTWRTGLLNPSFLFPPAVRSQVEEWVEDTTAGLQVCDSMSWVSSRAGGLGWSQ